MGLIRVIPEYSAIVCFNSSDIEPLIQVIFVPNNMSYTVSVVLLISIVPVKFVQPENVAIKEVTLLGIIGALVNEIQL